MKIAYITPYKIEKIVTGGEKYDNDVISIINDKTSHTASLHCLNLKKKAPLLLKPWLYLKESIEVNDYEVALINSAFFMRFALLPNFLRKRHGKKLISIHHHFMYQQLKGIKKQIYKYFEWNFLKQMDKIIVPSPYIYEILLTKIPKEKLSLHRIPFEKETPFTSSPKRGNLTYIGTIEPRKGLKYLLDALNLLKKKGKEYPLNPPVSRQVPCADSIDES